MVLVFAVNQKFVSPLAATLASIVESNCGEQITCYVLFDQLSNEQKQNLSLITQKARINLVFKQLDRGMFEGLPIRLHLDLACYYRLVIPDLVQEDRAIYLDSDLIVKGSLKPLWQMDLGENYLAAVPDFSGNWHPKLETDPAVGYFNSGVMVMNLSKWRADCFNYRVLEFSNSHPELVRFADQCGLNACASGNVLELDPKFNFQGIFYESSFRKPSSISLQKLEEAKSNSVIIHFTGTKKPWHWGSKHPDRGLYWKFLKKTPYKRRFPENPSFLNVLRTISPKAVLEICYRMKYKFKGLLSETKK